MPAPALLSVLVGLPQERGSDGKRWRTGYFKQPVQGPVAVNFEHIEGDGQALKGGHGGPDRVVCAYSADHFPAWEAEYPGHTFVAGMFGENALVEGLDEDGVCLGDRHRIGDLVLEVTQPRIPCKNIPRATGLENLFERVDETGRMGWLYRVIVAGELPPQGPITVEPGPHPGWSMRRVYDVFRRARRGDPTAMAEAAVLAAFEDLPADWRGHLHKALDKAGIAH